jgi:amino acid permease
VTLFSIVVILFTILLLIYELPLYMTREVPRGKLQLFNLDWNIFSAFGITFFAYNCQSGFYVAIEKLTKRDIGHKTSVMLNLSRLDREKSSKCKSRVLLNYRIDRIPISS